MIYGGYDTPSGFSNNPLQIYNPSTPSELVLRRKINNSPYAERPEGFRKIGLFAA
jgi:hypothetical protein